MATTTGSTKNYMPKVNELMYLVHGLDYILGIVFFISGLYSMFISRGSFNGVILVLVGLICLWAGTSSKSRVTFLINLVLGVMCLIGFTSRVLSYDGIGPELNLPLTLSNYALYGGVCFLFLLNAFVWILASRKNQHPEK
jgi:hypothetical protein